MFESIFDWIRHVFQGKARNYAIAGAKQCRGMKILLSKLLRKLESSPPRVLAIVKNQTRVLSTRSAPSRESTPSEVSARRLQSHYAPFPPLPPSPEKQRRYMRFYAAETGFDYICVSGLRIHKHA